MVGTEQRQPQGEGISEEPCYYTPAKVAYWLEHWRELAELAIPTAGAIRYDRPPICVPEGMRPSDQGKYAEIRADLLNAVGFVGGWWYIANQMCRWAIEGRDLVTVAYLLRVSIDVADKAWMDVCEVLAIDLGWKGR